jgi:hypothetical protein
VAASITIDRGLRVCVCVCVCLCLCLCMRACVRFVEPVTKRMAARSYIIRKENIFESSCAALGHLSDTALLAPLTVTFRGEEAVVGVCVCVSRNGFFSCSSTP